MTAGFARVAFGALTIAGTACGPPSPPPEPVITLEPVPLPTLPPAPAAVASGDEPPPAPERRTLPIGDAARPFAQYLNALHNRVHPKFADEFLESLAQLPIGDPLNGDLTVRLEIVVSGADGNLVRIGVVKTSGVTAFDAGALGAVHEAAPFGPAPEAVRSFDGNVYIHWDLHRDPMLACSTRDATPMLLAE